MDLVTGSTGFIGNVLVRKLLKGGHTVRAFLRDTSDHTVLDGLAVDRARGDILDPGSLKKALQGVDTVYHLAAKVSIMPGEDSALRKNNLEGTRNVLKACREAGVSKLIYTSSIHALKEPPEGTVIDEQMPYDPENQRGEYDRAKARASMEVMEAGKKDLHTVVLCPTGTLGPYDWRFSPITQTFLDYCNGRVRMAINGAYDFVDVRDVAEGHIMAAEKASSGENFILSGERVTLKQMFAILQEVTGIKAPSVYIPMAAAKVYCCLTPFYYRLSGKSPRYTSYSLNTLLSNSFISHQKASRELGYRPRTVKESVRDTIEWFRRSGFLDKT